ncbi:MAG TPA: SDR family oxidoreductase [Methylomusa anaerophila]|uniref:UDP-glucose 4-epimerase n=1 Tax=Methylomusa anaerophila TaxID=1930071 RepID=A0A348AM83_9FIRM|nr:UDP-glucuronic acid decarboxylase family protein [Methylomusa anaerophila]BBB92181.1 UDP-glucose 4-epimerase [Methylomusa anaerophila]HML87805.1 SDR family oxidoreductase [Methylomusa anaerophila]
MSAEKRVLVTGGAGFIGSHLCRRLLAEGAYVICLDNFYTGSRNNIAELMKHPRFELLYHDVVEPFTTEVDEIFNLACPASPVHYQADPVKTVKTSVLGVIHVLELARKLQAKVLHTSTSEVYGDPLLHPQPETYWGNVNPNGLRSCYDEGKRCAETLCFDYSRQYGLDLKVVRIFNTYGPNMRPDDGRVVSNFIIQALRGNELTVYGDGSQTRSFCYIDDLVEGIIGMMQTSEGFHGPVNLGNPDEFTILELAEQVIRLTGACTQIAYRPLPADDPRQRRPDISLAKTKLDWEPQVQLEIGLIKTIAYFRELAEQNKR